MGYREELLATKEDAYRALLSDIEEQRQDWTYLREETEWEQLGQFDREIVRLDDPELASALDDYEQEREQCRDILAETTTYIVRIAQHIDRTQNECMFREQSHEQDVEEHEIRYANSIISTSLGSHELVAVYGEDLARANDPQELGDVLLEENSFLEDRLDDSWRETFWNALKEEPTIDTLVEKYNMTYVDMLEQASQVEELVQDRIQGELLPVLHEIEHTSTYAS